MAEKKTAKKSSVKKAPSKAKATKSKESKTTKTKAKTTKTKTSKTTKSTKKPKEEPMKKTRFAVCEKAINLGTSFMVSEILSRFHKSPRWSPKVAKTEIFQIFVKYILTTLRVKKSVEIVLSLTISKILTFFLFFAKIQDGRQKW